MQPEKWHLLGGIIIASVTPMLDAFHHHKLPSTSGRLGRPLRRAHVRLPKLVTMEVAMEDASILDLKRQVEEKGLGDRQLIGYYTAKLKAFKRELYGKLAGADGVLDSDSTHMTDTLRQVDPLPEPAKSLSSIGGTYQHISTPYLAHNKSEAVHLHNALQQLFPVLMSSPLTDSAMLSSDDTVAIDSADVELLSDARESAANGTLTLRYDLRFVDGERTVPISVEHGIAPIEARKWSVRPLRVVVGQPGDGDSAEMKSTDASVSLVDVIMRERESGGQPVCVSLGDGGCVVDVVCEIVYFDDQTLILDMKTYSKSEGGQESEKRLMLASCRWVLGRTGRQYDE
ncbi:unnamed protein product [Vitrella brassicaformis CCMP3155]|uniref:Uncharacterized protein n=2 Tax=Vitrella brassicaformis TaxID=1169539 RepID=A0A0G4G7J5_VITBC|nr:unnamed protein product [Vitrella brassicaformis CCMP3155]|eukprot:CEM24374.1 unnamed protein product [Vitrella brassicaformis CCMP3155]